MQYAIFIGEILLATLILVIGYNYLSTYVLSKLKVNKWIVLAIGVLIFLMPNILLYFGININKLYSYMFSILFAVFLLWFFDLNGWTKRAANQRQAGKNDITIKPKAKPNRVKKNKEDNK